MYYVVYCSGLGRYVFTVVHDTFRDMFHDGPTDLRNDMFHDMLVH
jgi:hypothetical protein